MKFLLFTVLSFSFYVTQAQNNSLSGKIVNQKNEPIASVSVNIEGGKGTSTNIEGRYSLTVIIGQKYTLQISAIGYASKTITDVVVTNSNDNVLDIVLEAAAIEMTGVTVKATSRRQESTNALLSFQKNNTAMSSGLAADFIRRTPDKNSGEILKRVAGASIQDGKFVVVRGLSDRYNGAMINNALLPSSEPDKKAFSFDVFPASLIDNIIINKTATPDLPGEFAGGLVQVNTKDIPTMDLLTAGVSYGYNTQSTFKTFTSNERNSIDWLGFDDGTRKFPEGFPATAQEYRALGAKPNGLQDQLALSQLFNGDEYKPVTNKAAPIQTYNLTLGKSWKTKKQATIGTVIALTYRNSQLKYDVRKGLYEQDGKPIFQLADAQNKYQTNVGGLANFTYIKGRHKISLKTLFNQLFEDNYYTRTGYNTNRLNDLLFYSSSLNQRSLYSGQLEGEHKLTKKGMLFKWNGNAGFNWKVQPDLRSALYARSINTNDPYEIDPDDTRRFFSDLYDYSYGGGGQFIVPMKWGKISDNQTLKFGGSTLIRVRDFRSRILRYVPANNNLFDVANGRKPIETVFQTDNISTTGFVLDEFTNNQDKYFGISILNAGFAMLDNKFNKFRIIWGVRLENFEQMLTSRDQTGNRTVRLTEKLDVLPSLNIIYSLNNRHNIRVAGSRTVARPEFRELAEFAFFDYEQNYGVRGDTALRRTGITNIDARYEFYPKAGEAITVGAFYKSFDAPIEFRLDPSSNADSRRYFYQNAVKATIIGFEVEARKNLDFIGNSFENFSLFSNITVLYSEVTFNDQNSTSGQVKANRSLQGQSPYLINAGLQYNSKKGGFSGALLYNRIGPRLTLVGNDDFPSIYERPRNLLDLQLAKKVLNNRGELKFTVSDILNSEYYFYENVDTKKEFNKGTDRLFNAYTPGTTFTLGFTYDFNIGSKK
jgi:outer membrane receptor protein involved in Fe transport